MSFSMGVILAHLVLHEACHAMIIETQNRNNMLCAMVIRVLKTSNDLSKRFVMPCLQCFLDNNSQRALCAIVRALEEPH